MKFLHQETIERQAFIRGQGFDVVTIWEHEFDQLRKNNIEFHDFITDVNVREPLMPRDAFKVGRINAFKHLRNVGADEKVFYYDVTSGERKRWFVFFIKLVLFFVNS